MKTFRYTLLAVLLVSLLSACTITFRPGRGGTANIIDTGIFDFGNAITSFYPSRGHGSAYYIGDPIAFHVTTTRSGYLTLTVRNPDGTVDVFSDDYPVSAGTTIIDGFSVTYPQGYHDVRISLTPYPTNGAVAYRGNYSTDIWTQNIITDLDPFPASERGYAESSFYVY